MIPKLSYRHIVGVALTLSGIVMIFWLLYAAHLAFLLMLLAIMLSTAIQPATRWLRHWGISPTTAILALYGFLMLLLAVLALLVGPLLWEQSQMLLQTLPEMYTMMRNRLLENGDFFLWRIGASLPAAMTFSNGEQETTFSMLTTSLTAIGRAAFLVIVTLTLTFYWTVRGESTTRSLLLLVPSRRQREIYQLFKQIEEKLGYFLSGQVTLMVIVGLLSLIAYWLIGLPNALALAVFAGFMEAIPVVGPILGAAPAAAIALGQSPTLAFWTLFAGSVIQLIENNLLVPRVMKRAVGVNPLITLIALVIFSTLFGFLGAILAIPLAAVIQIVFERYVLQPQALALENIDGRSGESVLRYQTQELIKDIRRHSAAAGNAQFGDELETLAVDLDAVLAKRT